MVTGPEHLGLILEDTPLCLELTCSVYTTMPPTLKYPSGLRRITEQPASEP
jgi:hypothetical protein